MNPRERVLKGFGDFLEKLRGNRSLKQIEIDARKLGLDLRKTTLQLYEKGRVASLSSQRLETISQVFKMPYELVVNEYVKDRYGVDLLGTKLRPELVYPNNAERHERLESVLGSDDEVSIGGVMMLINAAFQKFQEDVES